jgi:membrane protease YdiL (CAAX protease family)
MNESDNPVPPAVLPPPLPELPPPLVVPPRGPWGFWATAGWGAVIGVAYLAAQFVVVAVCAAVWGVLDRGESGSMLETIESNGTVLSLAALLGMVPAVGLSWLFAKLRNGPTVRDYLGLNWPSRWAFVGWSLSLIGLVAASDLLTVSLGRPVVPEVMVEYYRSTIFKPLIWAALMLAAPLAEEVFFRGFLFRGWEASRLGGPGAVVLTSALWAVIHLQYDLFGIGVIFVAGLLLGFARWKTGSLLLCMVLHAAMNLVATVEVEIFLAGK